MHLKSNITHKNSKNNQTNKLELHNFCKILVISLFVVMLVSSTIFVTPVTAETYNVTDLSELETTINYAINHPTVHVDIHILNGNTIQLPKDYEFIIPFNVWFYIDYGAEFAINSGNTTVHNSGVVFIEGIINHSSNIYNNFGGKIFLGENCQIKGNNVIVTDGEPPIYLTNYWLVTFIATDGTFNDGRLQWVVEVPKNQPVVPEEKIPHTLIIDNLTFDCWFETSNGEKWDSAATITTNINLHAVLVTNTVAYIVIYDPGTHGTWNAIDETYIAYANDPTPTFGTNSKADITLDHDANWIFTGWNPYWTATVTDSITYVAQWLQEITPKHDFKVTYHDNGASTGNVPTDNNLYDSGEHVTIASNTGNLTKPGYTFTGWAYNPNTLTADFIATGNTIIPATFDIYENVDLYAVWKENTYTVTYQPGTHGTFSEQTTSGLHYGDPTPTPPTITGETGWTFTGWQPTPSATVTNNVTYTAQWTQIPTSPSPSTPTIPPSGSPSPTPTLSTSPSPEISPTFTSPNSTDFPGDGVNRLFVMLILGTISVVVLTVTIVWKGVWKKNDRIAMQKNASKELEQSWFTQLNNAIHKVSSKIVLYFGKILYFLTASSLFLALNFALVVHFSALLYEATITPINLLLAALTTIAIYSLNKVTDQTEDTINKPNQKTKFRSYFIIPAVVCYMFALIVGFTEGIPVVLVLLVPLIIGFIYSVKISKSLPRLKELLGVKNLVVAFSWAFTGSLLPALIATVGTKEILLVFIYIFIQLFINTVLFDIIDMSGDETANVKTIPLRLKTKKNIQYFLLIINSLLLIWLIFCLISNTFTQYLPVTTFGVLYSYATIYYFTTEKTPKRLLAEILIDGQWIPIVVFMWLLMMY